MKGAISRVGTRGSALALVQARLAMAALTATGSPSERLVIETSGDRRDPDTEWGEGAFVASIERALLDGRVDIAVHSAKDVPTSEDARLVIGAYLPRADARDALVVRTDLGVSTLEDLPAGSRIGTDSPRRTGFLLAARPDLEITPIHGNVDTRMRRLDAGEVEALVIAVAGLERLGLAHRISQRLAPDLCPPAPGQGAIGVQVRAEDASTRNLVEAIDHVQTRIAVELERAFLRAMGGGCRSPIGALADSNAAGCRLIGGIAAVDGSWSQVERVETTAFDPATLVRTMVDRLARKRPLATEPRVLVTRSRDGTEELSSALLAAGITVALVPAIAIESLPAGGDLDSALMDPGWDRVVVTSPSGARATLEAIQRLGLDPAAWRWAAVGATSAAIIHSAGVSDVWVPTDYRSAGLAAGLPIEPGERVLLVRGDLANERLPKSLRDRGATVREVLSYLTREAPPSSVTLLASAMAAGPPDAVLFASGSAARGLLVLAGGEGAALLSIPAICLGPETAAEAQRLGFRVIGSAPMQSARALAKVTATLLGMIEERIRP